MFPNVALALEPENLKDALKELHSSHKAKIEEALRSAGLSASENAASDFPNTMAVATDSARKNGDASTSRESSKDEGASSAAAIADSIEGLASELKSRDEAMAK